MSNYTLKPITELSALHHGAVKLAGAELGVESFGIQVLDFPADFAGYPERDHVEDAQEEVYAVLQGSGEFTIGCSIGRSYERPEGFRMAVPS